MKTYKQKKEKALKQIIHIYDLHIKYKDPVYFDPFIIFKGDYIRMCIRYGLQKECIERNIFTQEEINKYKF